MFATFGAEEHALHGSAYLAQNPVRPGGRRVAMVNLEKIGRVPDHPLLMVGCATSAEWLQVLGEANARSGAGIECPLPDLVADTDHYPFVALGTPAVVLGTAHEEDTHPPTDETSRLDFEALAGRAGRRPGDFVTGIDGQPLTAATQDRAIDEVLTRASSVVLAVRRDGASMTVRVEAPR